MSQASHTLASALRDIADGDFARACFKAQQAALVEVPDGLAHCVRELDKVCIPTRYPDVYDAGSPHEYFDHSDAVAHVECASAILAHLQGQMPDA